jgi:hypothetical protein
LEEALSIRKEAVQAGLCVTAPTDSCTLSYSNGYYRVLRAGKPFEKLPFDIVEGALRFQSLLVSESVCKKSPPEATCEHIRSGNFHSVKIGNTEFSPKREGPLGEKAASILIKKLVSAKICHTPLSPLLNQLNNKEEQDVGRASFDTRQPKTGVSEAVSGNDSDIGEAGTRALSPN